jgi:hypothetical protein
MDVIVIHKKQKGRATSFNKIRELALPTLLLICIIIHVIQKINIFKLNNYTKVLNLISGIKYTQA